MCFCVTMIMIIFFSVPLIISGLPMEPPVEAVPSPVSSVSCPTQDFDCNSCLAVEGCFYVEHKVSTVINMHLFVFRIIRLLQYSAIFGNQIVIKC